MLLGSLALEGIEVGQVTLELQSYSKLNNYCFSFYLFIILFLSLNCKRFHGKGGAAELLIKALRAMTVFEPFKCSWDGGRARVLLYSTCAWVEDSASPFQPTFSTKHSENLNTQCAVLMLETFYPLCQKCFVVTRNPIRAHCKLPAESKNLFATMIAG